MKYVMIQFTQGAKETITREFPIIFPNFLVHSSVFEAIRTMKETLPPNRTFRPLIGAKAVAAGEINFDNVKCGGESETLGIESRETDSKIILLHDYFGGILP